MSQETNKDYKNLFVNINSCSSETIQLTNIYDIDASAKVRNIVVTINMQMRFSRFSCHMLKTIRPFGYKKLKSIFLIQLVWTNVVKKTPALRIFFGETLMLCVSDIIFIENLGPSISPRSILPFNFTLLSIHGREFDLILCSNILTH